ncbi:MAG: hypothetical protein IAE79_27585 [Anaerolinea sp.]|nr:hypothetical protein [Anaerolinea sp.]
MRRLTIFLILFVAVTAVSSLFSLFTPIAKADDIGGVIDADTTWTLAGSPYTMVDVVSIQPGVTLTIEAGVEIQAQPDTAIVVNGTLLALGTPAQPITFTSTTETSPGEWQGVAISDSGFASFAHSTIRYAGVGLSVYGASANPVQLVDSRIVNNDLSVIVTAPSLHRLGMTQTVFSSNNTNRVIIELVQPIQALVASTTLQAQPGLEGFEIDSDDPYPQLIVPVGITLTLEPGVTIMSPQNGLILVDGHLEAQGTISQPITFTSAVNDGSGEWDALGIGGSQGVGTAVLQHVLIQNAAYGLGVNHHQGNGMVVIEDSMIHNSSSYPLETNLVSLSRLVMTNTTFSSNGIERVFIYTNWPQASLTAPARLRPQPGLEGYELGDNDNHEYTLLVPNGITLTLDPGTTLMMPEFGRIDVEGHLDATGATSWPITFTSASDNASERWAGLAIFATGTAYLEHVVMRFSNSGLGVEDQSAKDVQIVHSTFAQNLSPMWATMNALHRLQLHDVTFYDNGRNRIDLFPWPETDPELAANTTLTSQPGLEGYEFIRYDVQDAFIVPAGITLTMMAGTSLLLPDNSQVQVLGHLYASGTPTLPVTVTAVNNNEPWFGLLIGDVSDEQPGTGSAYLENMVISHAHVGLVVGRTAGRVAVQNSFLQNNFYGGELYVSSLHQLDMTYVTFADNAFNRLLLAAPLPESRMEGDATLTAQSGLEGYEIESANGLQIPAGITLTLAPGVTLMSSMYNEQDAIVVAGRLQAEGTHTERILLTSGQNNAPGQWQGVHVNGGEVSLAHADVWYATTNLTVNDPASRVIVTSTRFINSSVHGITIQDGQVNITCSVIAENGENGVFIANAGSPNVLITSSEIRDNGVGILNDHSLPVDARFNFWGDPSGPGGDGPGNGDAIYGSVLYEPWLLEPACLPPEEPFPTPTISITGSTAVESDPFLTFTITLNITSEHDVYVDYETVDDTAVAHIDYLPISGTLIIPAGQAAAFLIVTLVDNDLLDGDRSFALTLNNPVQATLAVDRAVSIILDDDLPPVFGWQVYLPLIFSH